VYQQIIENTGITRHIHLFDLVCLCLSHPRPYVTRTINQNNRFMKKMTGLLALLCLTVFHAGAQQRAAQMHAGHPRPSIATGEASQVIADESTTLTGASPTSHTSRVEVVGATVAVTATSGTASASYPTLKGAFDAINANTHGGVITITITGTTTETASASLTAGAYTSVLIKPSGASGISGSITGTGLITLNGADNVSFDGLNANGNSLSIVNTAVSSVGNTSTIRIVADATNLLFDHCTITSSYFGLSSTSAGCIAMLSGVTTGNDNITIRNSRIGGNGTNPCIMGIIASGTATVIQNGLVISNNEIVDVYGGVSPMGSIYLNAGTDGALVTGNRIYQTVPRTITVATTLYGIFFANTAGRVDITNNVIGYANAAGTGVTAITGTNSFTYRGIHIASSSLTGALSNVTGNTVAGLTLSSSKAATATNSSFFAAIDVGALSNANAAVNVIGNTIGDMNGTASISLQVNNQGHTGEVCIMNIRPSGNNISVSNNNIGGISFSGGPGITQKHLYSLLVWTTTANNGFTGVFQNNNIGGAVAGSIQNNIGSVSYTYGMEIYNYGGSVVSNTIQNMATLSTGGVFGLLVDGQTITTAITNNKAYGIQNTTPGAAFVQGIYVGSGGAGNYTVQRNSVHSLAGAEGNTIVGLDIETLAPGVLVATNNLVRLGTDASGNELERGNFIGLYEQNATSASIDHNSVSVAGVSTTNSNETSTAFQSGSPAGGNLVARNNVFSNTRSNGAGYSTISAVTFNAASPLASSYNDLWVTPGFLVGQITGGATHDNLPGWQSTGHDANSISVNPQFTEPLGTSGTGDLHAVNNALNAGTPIATITTDYANNARNATAPTIGAYEYVCAPVSATIAYAGSPFCTATGEGLVSLTGTTGGTFTSCPGLSLNHTTGAVDIASSSPGTCTVVYTMTSGCGGTASTTITIRSGTPTINSQPNQVLCAGVSNPATSFSSPASAGAVYSWTNSNTAIGLAASGTGDIPSFTATNISNAAITSTIRVSAAIGTGCSVKTMQFTITVKPEPSTDFIFNQNVCAGNPTTPISFSGPIAGTVFSWRNDNTSTGLIAAGTGNIAAFVVQNNTGATQVSQVEYTPTAGGCTGATGHFTITTTPSVRSVRYAAATYCQAGTANPTLIGSTGGSYSALPAGLIINATTGALNLALSTPGTYTVSYTLLVGCQLSVSTQVTINAQASVNPVPNQVYCNGISTAPVVFSGTAASYSWTNDNLSIGLGASGVGNLPSFTTVNAGPGVQYAYVRVMPQGNGSSTCPGKVLSFRITVNYCGPVTQAGDHSGDGNTGRISTGVSVSPNPATSQSTITMTESGSYTWQMLNRVGMPVGSPRSFTGTRATIDLSGMTPGSYMLQVVNVRTGVVKQVQVVKF
jgi:hypothetical protein